MSQLLFDYTKNKIIELIEKIEKKKNEEKFYFNDNQKQKKQLIELINNEESFNYRWSWFVRNKLSC